MFTEKQQAKLGSWRVWRHIERLRLLDAASLGVELSDDESEKAWKDFCEKQLKDDVTRVLRAVHREFENPEQWDREDAEAMSG